MPTRAELYLAHLDRLTDSIEPDFQPVDSTHPGLPRVMSIIYRDLPGPGLLTGLTYGLSLAEHSEWPHGKPELCISVQSEDISWPLAVAYLAEHLRGEAPFCYGDTLNFGEQIVPESKMTAFAIFAPAVLDREDFLNIDVGDARINIAGCYPIHDVERQYIQEYGLEDFWRRDWDPYDVTRPPAV